MPFDELVKRACEEPTLAEALAWAALVDCDRAVKQAIRNTKSGERGPEGALYDTTFLFLFKMVIEQYALR